MKTAVQTSLSELTPAPPPPTRLSPTAINTARMSTSDVNLSYLSLTLSSLCVEGGPTFPLTVEGRVRVEP
jgi:hypothetical protein